MEEAIKILQKLQADIQAETWADERAKKSLIGGIVLSIAKLDVAASLKGAKK